MTEPKYVITQSRLWELEFCEDLLTRHELAKDVRSHPLSAELAKEREKWILELPALTVMSREQAAAAEREKVLDELEQGIEESISQHPQRIVNRFFRKDLFNIVQSLRSTTKEEP